MLEFVIADPAMMKEVLSKAHVEIRMQSPSVFSMFLINGMRAAAAHGAKSYVLIGPRAEYQVDNGKMFMGRDPYPSAAQEFKQLEDAKAEVFINPRFSNLGATGPQPGRESHASYITVDSKLAFICTGKLSEQAFSYEKNICIKTDDKKFVTALNALHRADFDDTIPAAKRDEEEAQAAATLAITPVDNNGLLDFVQKARGPIYVRTASLTEGSPYFKALDAVANRLTVSVSQSDIASWDALNKLKAHGAYVQRSPYVFDGTLIYDDKFMFVGSQRMTKNSALLCREVGVLLDKKSVVDHVPGGMLR